MQFLKSQNLIFICHHYKACAGATTHHENMLKSFRSVLWDYRITQLENTLRPHPNHVHLVSALVLGECDRHKKDDYR